jgi:hypothetical protein
VENRTQIDLPSQVSRPFEVFVNGVQQVEGTDFELVGSSLVFQRSLEREGAIGFWRWARMALGIAGTYRKNDLVDIVYTHAGRRSVVTLAPPPRERPTAPAS